MKDEFSVSLSVLRMVGLIDRWTYKHILVSLVGAYAFTALIGRTEIVVKMYCRSNSLAVFFDRRKNLHRQGWRQLIVRLSRTLQFMPGSWREPVRTELDCLAIDFGVAASHLLLGSKRGGGNIPSSAVSFCRILCTFSFTVHVVVVYLVPLHLPLAEGGGRHFFVIILFLKTVQLSFPVTAVFAHHSYFPFNLVIASQQVVVVHGAIRKVFVAEVRSEQSAAFSHAF